MLKPIPESCAAVIGSNETSTDHFDKDDLYKIYDAIGKAIDREITVINQRLNWAVIISSAYLTAEAFVGSAIIRDLAQQHAYDLQGLACLLLAGISFSAVIICKKAEIAIAAAADQKDYIRSFYFNTKIAGENLFEAFLALPRPFGENDKDMHGNVAAQTIPPLLINMWSIATVIELIAALIFLVLKYLKLT